MHSMPSASHEAIYPKNPGFAAAPAGYYSVPFAGGHGLRLWGEPSPGLRKTVRALKAGAAQLFRHVDFIHTTVICTPMVLTLPLQAALQCKHSIVMKWRLVSDVIVPG